MIGVAFAAINRTIVPRLERNFAFFSAGSAYSIKHFALRSAVVLTGIAARFASLWLVSEALFLEEILFACGEYKFLAAIYACECFVLMNQLKYLDLIIYVGLISRTLV